MANIALTGIEPTDTPHIGNYLGIIKPVLEFAQSFQGLNFITDYYVLMTTRERNELNHRIYGVAATQLTQKLVSREGCFLKELKDHGKRSSISH